MNEIEEALSPYRRAWMARQSPLGPLIHTFYAPAESSIVEEVFGDNLPPKSVLEFWKRTAGGRLYEDVTYGQWGLILFAPEKVKTRSEEAYKNYPENYRASDLVLGEFLGDQDVLFIVGEAARPDFGRVYVASPLDSRSEWSLVGDDLADFLRKFAQANGEKFWERY
ncbi:SMI1/KNR4 family protein [Deinococcus sp. YIM 134068]|uniref:SMI1/KNR4 family protein n=1 Tax=Deinococcus lichenicola TaxID=3118910 RepID=UPI002F91E02A